MINHKTEDYKFSEVNVFYSKIKQYPLNKIIYLDESSVGSALHPQYSRYKRRY